MGERHLDRDTIAQQSGILERSGQVLAGANENHAMPVLRNTEVRRVQQPCLNFIAPVGELADDCSQYRATAECQDAFDVLSNKGAGTNDLDSRNEVPIEGIPVIVDPSWTCQAEALTRETPEDYIAGRKI